MDEIERQKQELAEAAQRQQEARERELEELDAMVDSILSKDSEEFLEGVRQPGGE